MSVFLVKLAATPFSIQLPAGRNIIARDVRTRIDFEIKIIAPSERRPKLSPQIIPVYSPYPAHSNYASVISDIIV
jgi:hypothetical protein